MSKPDGGPAFPELEAGTAIPLVDRDGYFDLQFESTVGMSLRDYFAGQALALVLSQDGSRIAQRLAEQAYEIADALLKERAK